MNKYLIYVQRRTDYVVLVCCVFLLDIYYTVSILFGVKFFIYFYISCLPYNNVNFKKFVKVEKFVYVSLFTLRNLKMFRLIFEDKSSKRHTSLFLRLPTVYSIVFFQCVPIFVRKTCE